ncbi:MAG: SDR family oxidoreductase [Desulfobacteraceae bacterium]|nr:SDR family oxidoreductase [Desulfobacteraceae bacterium]
MEIHESEIKPYEILMLKDKDFNPANVCIITGVGSGVGRAVAIAAAKNHLTVVGLDNNKTAGEKTLDMVAGFGGRMEFILVDLLDQNGLRAAYQKAAIFGRIRYLVNIAGVQSLDSIENFPMGKHDPVQPIVFQEPFLPSEQSIHSTGNDQDQAGSMCAVHACVSTTDVQTYTITKFGLKKFKRTLPDEQNNNTRPVCVSTISLPGQLIPDHFADQVECGWESKKKTAKDFILDNRAVQLMTPIEVANMIIFGFSCHSDYLMGSDILSESSMMLAC